MAKSKQPTPPARRKFDPQAPRKGDRRRELLLDSAEELLSEVTAEALTLDDVAARAGLSRSGVYFYFDNKWALVDALIDLRSEELTLRALRDVDDKPVPDLMAQFIDACLWSWQNHRAVFCAGVERGSHGGNATANWRSVMEACLDAMVPKLTADTAADIDVVGDARAACEMAAWMVERNFFMLFSREHEPAEEKELADNLVEASMRILGVTRKRKP
ncbi:MAG: TetR/AcrR family transcriptional regulator [Actinomycetota bacterium]|nr:TetR/AcrR family transcriptional regulator [Actinomycetota bacterium]